MAASENSATSPLPDPAQKTAEDSKAKARLFTTTSAGFHPPLAPEALRRSLILSAGASACGAVFFTVVQGTVFFFFLEQLQLRDRLPFFMGLWCVGNLGTLVGSWIQERWGSRKELFMLGIGASRIIWLIIGLIPLLRPEWATKGPAWYWLTALTLLFYFIHSLGANAWISWMADLVPAHLQSKYWSLRQVGCSMAGIAARIGFGYYLSEHHNYKGFAVIFVCAAIFGIMDALLFLGVEHRRPRIRTDKVDFFREFGRRIKEPPFRRLIGVYLLWSISNCVMGPTCFYYMRDHIGMGVASISIAEAISLGSFTVFSLLWGQFSDHHGHRGPLVLCLLVQTICPVFYFFAHRGDDYLATLAMSIGSIGFCGIQLFMWPMLINFTKGKGGGREVGMAAFTVLMGLSNFIALIVTDRWLYPSVSYLTGYRADSKGVYLVVIMMVVLLRFMSAALAWLLPEKEEDTSPGIVITEVVSTNPLRATWSFFRYVTGQEGWESRPRDDDENEKNEDDEKKAGPELKSPPV